MTKSRIVISILIIALFSIGINQIVPTLSQEDETIQNVLFDLNFSPPSVEAGVNTYSIGYINIISEIGSPSLLPDDITVKLVSKNPSLVAVPSEVVVPKNNDYAKFDISVGDLEGKTEIIAMYGNYNKTKSFRVGGTSVEVPLATELQIDLPATKMHVGTTMPLSVFLHNNGTIVQAPKDIVVFFAYENSIIKLTSDIITIKKGDYYATTEIKSLEKTGNAFITVITQEPPLTTVKSLTVSSSLPSKLKVDVLPSRVIEKSDRTIDLFVSLLDSDNNPVVANKDIPLELFSNLASLDQDLDDDFEIKSPIIKQGQWGFYHRVDNTLFQENTDQNFVGAISSGYGSAQGFFKVVDELDPDNELAENKTIGVTVISPMPPDTIAPIVYQIFAKKGTDDDISNIEDKIRDGVIDPHPFYPEAAPAGVEETDFEFSHWPLRLDFEDFNDQELKGRFASSDTNIVEIIDGGKMSPKRSFATAFIKSGPTKEGAATISVAVKGIGSGQSTTTVYNPLAPQETKIYSPAGQDRIVFNNEGISELYLITLDSQQRPTLNKEKIQYLLEPLNQLIELDSGLGFTKIQLQSSSFAKSLLAGTANITVSPIGADVNTDLKENKLLQIAPSSSITTIFLPTSNVVVGEKTHPFGIVQLVDFFGNPVPVSKDLKVGLVSNNLELATVPTIVTLSAGKSFIEFPITIAEGEGSVGITATSQGFFDSNATLNVVPFTKELIITPPAGPVKFQQPSELVFYVDDNYGETVEDAQVTIKAQNVTIFPQTLSTNEFGEGKILVTPHIGPTIELTIEASKNGYVDATSTADLAVDGYVVEQKKSILFGVAPWVLYVAIGGLVGGVGVVVMMIMRKPKPKLEEEEEEL